MILEETNIESLIKNDKEGISFFVPCLNEEINIVNTLNTIKSAVNEIDIDYEILIFDDFSKDNSVSLIKEFCLINTNMPIILIKNMKTMGLGRNYVDGSYIAQYKYYMCIFGGNSEPKETIKSMIRCMGKADMIIPNYNLKNRTIFKKLLSLSFTILVNLISGNSIRYYNWSVIHLRRNVMRWHSDTNGFGYQAEIITRLLSKGATYFELNLPNSDKHLSSSNALRIQNILSVLHSLIQIFFRRLRSIIFKV